MLLPKARPSDLAAGEHLARLKTISLSPSQKRTTLPQNPITEMITLRTMAKVAAITATEVVDAAVIVGVDAVDIAKMANPKFPMTMS